MKFNKFAAVAALGMCFGAPAHAAYVVGSISFSDGFMPVPTRVSTATSFNQNGANTNAATPTGDFATYVTDGDSVTSAGVIDTAAPGGVVYSIGGFTFTLTGISSDTNTPFSCTGGLCSDARQLVLTGTVSGNGFDNTDFIGIWTGNGSCLGSGSTCTITAYSPSWSISLSALGTSVPEPGSLALLGLGLIGLGAARRRKA